MVRAQNSDIYGLCMTFLMIELKKKYSNEEIIPKLREKVNTSYIDDEAKFI